MDVPESVRGLSEDETLSINSWTESNYDNDNPRLRELFEHNPLWKRLLDIFISDVFLRDIQEFTSPAMRDVRGHCGLNDWYYTPNWVVAPRSTDGTPAGVTFKLFQLTQGQWTQPHTGMPSKVITMLLYFAEPDWNESYGRN